MHSAKHASIHHQAFGQDASFLWSKTYMPGKGKLPYKSDCVLMPWLKSSKHIISAWSRASWHDLRLLRPGSPLDLFFILTSKEKWPSDNGRLMWMSLRPKDDCLQRHWRVPPGQTGRCWPVMPGTPPFEPTIQQPSAGPAHGCHFCRSSYFRCVQYIHRMLLWYIPCYISHIAHYTLHLHIALYSHSLCYPVFSGLVSLQQSHLLYQKKEPPQCLHWSSRLASQPGDQGGP